MDSTSAKHLIYSKVQTVVNSFRKQKERGAFSRFKDLPLELRLLIWDFAMPSFPRSINLQPYTFYERFLHSVRPPTRPISRYPYYCVVPGCRFKISSGPVLLHVNQEARYELMKYYGNGFLAGALGLGSEDCQGLRFNPKTDTVFLKHIDSPPITEWVELDIHNEPHGQGRYAFIAKRCSIEKGLSMWDVDGLQLT